MLRPRADAFDPVSEHLAAAMLSCAEMQLARPDGTIARLAAMALQARIFDLAELVNAEHDNRVARKAS